MARADAGRLFAELDAKIEEGMASYGIPGVAVGVLCGPGWYTRKPL
jgi:tetrahydromethanopterin S-methyltransferase subunit F